MSSDRTSYLRFSDLKNEGIVCSRATLSRRIKHQNFPEGIKLTDHQRVGTRLWRREDVEAWIASRSAAA